MQGKELLRRCRAIILITDLPRSFPTPMNHRLAAFVEQWRKNAWFFSTFYITPDGKEQHGVVINKIEFAPPPPPNLSEIGQSV